MQTLQEAICNILVIKWFWLFYRMLAPSSKLKDGLQQHYKRFECAVGINGRIWVRSPRYQRTVAIANTIMDCSQLNDSQLTEHFQTLPPEVDLYDN